MLVSLVEHDHICYLLSLVNSTTFTCPRYSFAIFSNGPFSPFHISYLKNTVSILSKGKFSAGPKAIKLVASQRRPRPYLPTIESDLDSETRCASSETARWTGQGAVLAFCDVSMESRSGKKLEYISAPTGPREPARVFLRCAVLQKHLQIEPPSSIHGHKTE
jgi:hypothetical protein